MCFNAVQRFRALLGVLLLLSFGSASPPDLNVADAEIQIEQLPASDFVVKQGGAISIAYQITVRNRSAEELTLRQLEMRAVGRSPYVLRNTPVSFHETIAPGKETALPFEMWANVQEGRANPSDRVWVTGTAYFESAGGPRRKDFSQSFAQPPPAH